MNRIFYTAWMLLLPFATFAAHTAVSQEICGEFETVPGSTVRYMYLPGTPDFETLPIRATFAISCNDYSLTATIFTPIIGIDEDGNEIFPTGLVYPVVATADYDPATNYTASLQATQYHYGWEFHQGSGNGPLWSGFVSWFGGRYEETSIDNVLLRPVPEPTGFCLLIIALVTYSHRRDS